MPFLNKTRTVFIILLALAVGLALTLIYSNRGYRQLLRLKQEQKIIESANEELEEQNRKLMMQIDKIKNDPRYIEEVARKKLGLVRPDELIFKLKDDPGSKTGGVDSQKP